jgi:hypothetical protein
MIVHVQKNELIVGETAVVNLVKNGSILVGAIDVTTVPQGSTSAPLMLAPPNAVFAPGDDIEVQLFVSDGGGETIAVEVVVEFQGPRGPTGATGPSGGPAGPTGPTGPAPTAVSGLLAIYGNGSYGDYVTAGDETWTSVAGAPGSPIVPVGSTFPFAFFNNLTISPGDSVAVGGFTDSPTNDEAIVIFVKETLTIGAGARIHANGGDGAGGVVNPFGNPGGPGRRAIQGSSDGAPGGTGGGPLVGNTGSPGSGGPDRPATFSATHVGGAGGAGGAFAGGAGGTDQAPPSWPYSLSQAISIASLLFKIGGGNGGGGGGAASSSAGGGGGGGGAGTLIIFARTIVAPAGSIQAIGGNGGPGGSTENQAGGGGGGATGGFILIITDNLSVVGMADVSGGLGGAGAGFPADPGAPGGPGEIVAFNPVFGVLAP